MQLRGRTSKLPFFSERNIHREWLPDESWQKLPEKQKELWNDGSPPPDTTHSKAQRSSEVTRVLILSANDDPVQAMLLLGVYPAFVAE